jgi:flagellar basal-body rod modification protein FlgD
MSVSAITSNSAFGSSAASSSSSTSSLDTTQFLSLLVTELQNQNPLDPTDTSEFMGQMMSYASYNQQVDMNNTLTSVLSSMNSMLASNAVGFVGRNVEAYGDTAMLQNGQASWGYSLNSSATNVTLTVKDADGNTVYQTAGDTSSGKHTFTWDGTTSSGSKAPDGAYTVEVSATDSSGSSVYGYTTVSGTVTGVDSTSGTNMLMIGDAEVAFDDVIKVTT